MNLGALNKSHQIAGMKQGALNNIEHLIVRFAAKEHHPPIRESHPWKWGGLSGCHPTIWNLESGACCFFTFIDSETNATCSYFFCGCGTCLSCRSSFLRARLPADRWMKKLLTRPFVCSSQPVTLQQCAGKRWKRRVT